MTILEFPAEKVAVFRAAPLSYGEWHVSIRQRTTENDQVRQGTTGYDRVRQPRSTLWRLLSVNDPYRVSDVRRGQWPDSVLLRVSVNGTRLVVRAG